jgi:hypothetical protein
VDVRRAAWLAVLAGICTGCDILLGIPARGRLADGGGDEGTRDDAGLPKWDATAPDVGAPALGDGGPDATASEGGTDGGLGPDCATTFDPNWAAWTMPNAAQDVEAGSPNPESYEDLGDGTVTDKVTGLMWQKTLADGTLAWKDAKDTCAMLGLAGHHDWRLPSYIELVSIVDYGPSSPAVNPRYFPNTPPNLFWSVTVSPDYATPWVYLVDFTDGATTVDGTAGAARFRCVRGSP